MIMIRSVNKQNIQVVVLEQAAHRLEEALLSSKTDITRDAVIQRFEFTFELAWKLMQHIAQSESLETYGPKNSIREAAKLGLINNPEVWFKLLKSRNLTTHTYNEDTAEEVYQDAKKFLPEVVKLIEKAEKRFNILTD